jgi:hypothetical protein
MYRQKRRRRTRVPRRRWSVKDDTCGYSDRSEENGKEHHQYHAPYDRTGNQKTLVRIFLGCRWGFFRKRCFVRCHFHLHAFTVFRARRGPGQEASRQANPSRCGRQTQYFRSCPAIPLKPDVLSGRVMGAAAPMVGTTTSGPVADVSNSWPRLAGHRDTRETHENFSSCIRLISGKWLGDPDSNWECAGQSREFYR